MTDESPISLQVISFLALDALTQEKLIGSEIPRYRGCPGGPIEQLVNAVQTRAGFFFDHYPGASDESMLEELSRLSQLVATRDSKEDFLLGAEWQELRDLARAMLRSSLVEPVDVPEPAPLRDWVCGHYAR